VYQPCLKEADKHTVFEKELVWLYCRAWGNHADHILEISQFKHFDREFLRLAILEICFPDPEKPNPDSNEELVTFIKNKIASNGSNLVEWCDSIYKETIQTSSSKNQTTDILPEG